MTRGTFLTCFFMSILFLMGCSHMGPRVTVTGQAEKAECQSAKCQTSAPTSGQCGQKESHCARQRNCQKKAMAHQDCAQGAKGGGHQMQGEGHQMHGGRGKGMHSAGCGGGRHGGHGGGHGKHAGGGQHGGMHKDGGSGCGMMQVESAPAEIVKSDAPGARQLVQNCSQCHAAPDPAQHQANEWEEVVARMLMKMEHHGMELPSEKDQQELLEFLKGNAENAEDLF